MEEILASIRKIIAEGGEEAAPGPDARSYHRRPDPAPESEGVPELTEAVEAADTDDTGPESLEGAAPSDSEPAADPIASDETINHGKAALAALAAMTGDARNAEGEDNGQPLEGLVQDMLKPMLKEWLDTNLPAMVEAMVAREIARISTPDK